VDDEGFSGVVVMGSIYIGDHDGSIEVLIRSV
jgi:hypothetical protein